MFRDNRTPYPYTSSFEREADQQAIQASVTRAAPTPKAGGVTSSNLDDQVRESRNLITVAIPQPLAALGLWLARLEGSDLGH